MTSGNPPAVRLQAHAVEKPWGRAALPDRFDGMAADGRRIGEIWFTAPDGRPLPLLVKYIFTSDRLSVQVHPDDAQARARGLPHGKSECWYILDADPGAAIGLGFTREIGDETLRKAARDGSIEALMDWRPVRVGDVFSVPATTVHTIGAGVSLIEVQQQSDVTYRLYDHSRGRALHLDDAVAVACRRPYPDRLASHLSADGSGEVTGPHFRMAHVIADGLVEALHDRERWVLPLSGRADAAEATAGPGDCLLLAPGAPLVGQGRLLIAAAA